MLLVLAEKNWDHYVAQAEEVARCRGFRDLRDAIVERAGAGPEEVVVDVGAGTGLLTLPFARQARRVWAVDISRPMVEYLTTKVASAELCNVEGVVASAVSLPLVDASAQLVVSNYCLHHLSHEDKRRALAEMHRILVPGGRLVLGDMMFTVSVTSARDRRVVAGKVRSMARRGPAGLARLVKNAVRIASRRWERPARSEWWRQAIEDAGFADVEVVTLDHEGGIASARKR